MAYKLLERVVQFNEYETTENGEKVTKSFDRRAGGIYLDEKGNRYLKLDTLFGTRWFSLFPPNEGFEKSKTEASESKVDDKGGKNWSHLWDSNDNDSPTETTDENVWDSDNIPTKRW